MRVKMKKRMALYFTAAALICGSSGSLAKAADRDPAQETESAEESAESFDSEDYVLEDWMAAGEKNPIEEEESVDVVEPNDHIDERFREETEEDIFSDTQKHYDWNEDGGDWDGENYTINGRIVRNAFFCDGTYTYYLQADGTPMIDRLTYHPDGVHVIYFDSEGHEVFSNFAHVKRSISGDTVDDLCFFDVYGYMYTNVLTYNQKGDRIYYANPYGVMECNGWFQFAENAGGIAGAIGVLPGMWGYAYADGRIDALSIGNEDVKNSYVINSALAFAAQTGRESLELGYPVWIDAYKKFLANKEYPNYERITSYGIFRDLNADGIPELIIKNSFGSNLNLFYYTYAGGGTVRMIDISELVSGLFNDISLEDIYKYVEELPMALDAYVELSYLTEDVVSAFESLEALLNTFSFCAGGEYDSEYPMEGFLGIIATHPSVAEWNYGFDIEQEWNQKDPQGRYESYFSIREEDVRWVAQQVYNISDEDYNALLQNLLDGNCYMENGRIYSFMGGVGGPATDNVYIRFWRSESNQFLYVTFEQYHALDDYFHAAKKPKDPFTKRRTYKLSLKQDPVHGTFWSLYRVSE